MTNMNKHGSCISPFKPQASTNDEQSFIFFLIKGLQFVYWILAIPSWINPAMTSYCYQQGAPRAKTYIIIHHHTSTYFINVHIILECICLHPWFVSSFCSRLISQVQSLWVSTFIFQTWDVRDDSNHRVSGLSICPRNFLGKKTTSFGNKFSVPISHQNHQTQSLPRETQQISGSNWSKPLDPPSGWLRIMPKTVRKAGMASQSRHSCVHLENKVQLPKFETIQTLKSPCKVMYGNIPFKNAHVAKYLH